MEMIFGKVPWSTKVIGIEVTVRSKTGDGLRF